MMCIQYNTTELFEGRNKEKTLIPKMDAKMDSRMAEAGMLVGCESQNI